MLSSILGWNSMPLAIHHRAIDPQFVANSFGICTCKTPRSADFLSPAVSALAQTPRICTFHSHFKSRSFCTCPAPPPISFSFCTYENGGYPPSSRVTRMSAQFTRHELRPPLERGGPTPFTRRGGRCTLRTLSTLDSRRSTSRIYLCDLPQLRNSISRNPFVFNAIRIPGGGGYPGFYAIHFQLLTRLPDITASTFSKTPPREVAGNACETRSRSFGICLSPARGHSQRKETSAPPRRPAPEHLGTIPFPSPNVH